MSGCPFCAIVAGQAPGHVVWRDAGATAFLDIRPLFPGHCLVVPTRHVEALTELEPAELLAVMTLVQRVVRGFEAGLGADGALVAVNQRVSQSVPHMHVHAVPRRFKDGLKGFFWPRHRYPHEDEAAEVALRIREAMPSAPG